MIGNILGDFVNLFSGKTNKKRKMKRRHYLMIIEVVSGRLFSHPKRLAFQCAPSFLSSFLFSSLVQLIC